MKKGFTLVELALSLSILAMLIFLASTTFLNLAPKYELEKAVWEVRSALNAARYKALFEGTSFRFRLYPSAYSLEKYEDGSKGWTLVEKHLLEDVSIESNNVPVFTPEGTVTGLATIYIANAWGRYKITLAITGRIKAVRIA
ncbi:MAG: prepilin-type N-terminal cleavage/methylation domain-containing protein [Candidatus Aminicenantes bacterium]|nr:prepilin-type N-terminal cleavage/methylation domain-containing protein [Candidatus Aminicenantes bacterium]